MYAAYLNDNLFFSTSSNLNSLKLITAQLELHAGQAGTFTFEVAPDNTAYNSFAKLTSYVDVYRDTVLLFSGRVIEIAEGFNLCRTIVCEGLLAILADSVFRPQTYNVTLQDLVQAMITSHNDQVDSTKQLTIGTITIEDEYVYRAYEDYESTISRLMDLVDSYGGYMTVTKQGSTLYFDWRESIAGLNSQGIDFGNNLLDITQTESATEIVTVLVPLGAEIENEDGTSQRLTISAVNNGNDYIINQNGINEYGKVVGINIWDDVTVDSILLSKAQAYLNAHAVNRVSINVAAADLAFTDDMIDYFMIGQTIHVTSAVHGINDNFVALEQSLNLLDPSQDRMVLANTFKGYISTLQKAVKNNSSRVDAITHDYVTNDTVSELNDQLAEQSSLIQQNADSITSVVETVNGTISGVTDRLTAVEQTAESWSAYVTENGEVLTYLRLDASGLWIGRSEDPIQLLETNSAIKFVDGNNNALLEINTEGVITPSVSASEQVAFLSGTTPEWAIRKGAVVNGKHNLNDLWIGG